MLKTIAEVLEVDVKYFYEDVKIKVINQTEEYGEEVEVIFLDEDKVRMIIKLGIQEYLKRENEKGE